MSAYLLRPGKTPGIALYTRCQDELLCQSEPTCHLYAAYRKNG